MMPLYYTIEKKEDSQSAEWEPLTDHKIDPEEASYLSKFHIMYRLWTFVSWKLGEKPIRMPPVSLFIQGFKRLFFWDNVYFDSFMYF